MASFQIYQYTILDGSIVSGPTLVTIDPDGAGGGVVDGLISQDEWAAFTGGSSDHNGALGDVIWDGDNASQKSGTLYSPTPLTQEEIDGILGNLTVSFDPIQQADLSFCFVRGSMILTANGQRAVEDLAAGDEIVTLDKGCQPIRWIGSSKVAVTSSNTPIRFKAGALGNGLPVADLLVSPCHRMLVKGWRAELLFGEREVLVSAQDLVNDDTIRPATEMTEVEYFHVLFDHHEIVFANGAPSESFNPSEAALSIAEDRVREEICAIFPNLAVSSDGFDAVRAVMGKAEARRLIAG